MAKQVDIGPRGGAWLRVVFLVWVACSPGCKTSGLQDEQADGCPSSVTSSSRNAGDTDGDGVRSVACGGGDCDDADPSVFPGASEVSGDAIDQNCDGRELCYADGDGDGYGNGARKVFSAALACDVAGLAPTGDDCDDNSPRRNPGLVENCGDEIDQNCDGISDFDDERCDYNSIGCVSSAFADLSDGVAYALKHGLSSVYVCAGEYEEVDTVEIDDVFTLVGDAGGGGVRLRSSALRAVHVHPTGAGTVRLERLSIECESTALGGVIVWAHGVGSGTDAVPFEMEIANVGVSGCQVGIDTSDSGDYVMHVEDSTFSENYQGVLLGSGVVADFRRVTFADNDGAGAVGLESYNGGDYDLYFEECEFTGNAAEAGGAALNLDPLGSSIGSVGNVVLQDCNITANSSNAVDWSGGSGAIQMYFGEQDQPTVTMYGGSVTENVSILGERASGIHVYTGTFTGYDVDFGLGVTDNTPVDVDGLGSASPTYRFGTSASFFCESTAMWTLHCEE